MPTISNFTKKKILQQAFLKFSSWISEENRLTDRLTNRLTNRLTDWLTDRPTDRPTDQPTDQPANQPANWSINPLIYLPIYIYIHIHISDVSRVFLGRLVTSWSSPSPFLPPCLAEIFKPCASICSKNYSLAVPVLSFLCKTFSKLRKLNNKTLFSVDV